ncbi:MAG: hypothetical protein ACXWE9_08850 [Methylobacter sp.]
MMKRRVCVAAVIAIILIISGLWILADGSLSYTDEIRKTREGKSDSSVVSVTSTRIVSVPAWAGIAAIIAGSLILASLDRSS